MQLSPSLRRLAYYLVEEAGAKVGWSRTEAYRAVKRGDIPVKRAGRFLLVPKQRWDRRVERLRQELGLKAIRSTPKAGRPTPIKPRSVQPLRFEILKKKPRRFEASNTSGGGKKEAGKAQTKSVCPP
jgi:hypothetical protein